MLHPGPHDAQARSGDRRQPDERPHFDVIRADAMRGPPERSLSMDGDGIGADPLDARAHGNQERARGPARAARWRRCAARWFPRRGRRP